MKKNLNQRMAFVLPEGVTVVDVIDEILTNNNIGESDDEYFNKSAQGKEPRLLITRDAAVVLFEKKVPENKLVELLAKHLETSKETAQKIIADIKQKLIPYAKKVPLVEGKPKATAEPTAQELLIEKIKGGGNTEYRTQKTEEQDETVGVKKVEVKDVEESAEKLKQQREESAKSGTTGGAIRKGQPDPYREATE